MKTVGLLAYFFLVIGGGSVTIRIWASRRFARRTGQSVFDGIGWRWFVEPVLGVPAGAWALAWLVASGSGLVALLVRFGGE